MTVHHETQTTEKACDARQRLLDAAIVVFANKGFEAASVREICSLAGVNIAGVNYYFRDKEKLYIEAAKHSHLSACGRVAESVRDIDPAISPVDQLRYFIREMATRMHAPADPHAVQIMMREMANPSVAGEAVVKEYVQPLAFRLREILRSLLPAFDEPHLLMVGFSIIGQILYYRQNRCVSELIFGPGGIGSLNSEMVVDHITRFTFAALGLAEPIAHPATTTLSPSANETHATEDKTGEPR